MKRLLKPFKTNKAEGYIDTVVCVMAAMMVIVLALGIVKVHMMQAFFMGHDPRFIHISCTVVVTDIHGQSKHGTLQ